MSKYNAQFTSVIDESIECKIFSVKCSANENYWLHLRNSIQDYIDCLSRDYIWHKDKFELYLPILSAKCNTNDLPDHLYSTAQFGENIEDEWFIVYLIFEITKQFQDVIIQVNDNDGEFLLIEAADVLPKWVNPNNTDNRVFIYQGDIHLIPPNIIDVKESVRIRDALNAIIKFPNQTKSSEAINSSVQNRIKEYPEKIKHNLHKAITVIPRSLATLLSLKPELISGLVDAYCNQDYLDKKFCKNIKDENIMETSVIFTKFMYAMLIHSKPVSNQRNNKKIELGLKLTAGYQILINKSMDIISSKQWVKFLNNLKKVDYFDGNIEGSRDYLKLLEKAKEYFTKQECSSITKIANEIENLKKSNEYKTQYEKFNDNVSLIEDDDDWLKIHPGQLEELLKSRYGKQAKFEDKGMMTPHTISTQLSKFLHESSDFEGIENVQSDDRIDFDVNTFSDELKNILDLVLPEERVTSDSDEDFSDENDSDIYTSQEETKMDIELRQSLLSNDDGKVDTPNKVYTNLMQSMKEEGNQAGPSSLLMKNIGINKIELLDSDDDEDIEIKT